MLGKVINTLLTTNQALTTLVPATKIFPYVMNEDTTAPAIVYMIDSVSPSYNKGGWAFDEIEFSVHAVAKDFTSLQGIVAAIREACEWMTSSGISPIRLAGMEETYIMEADVYYNKLRFITLVTKY